MLSELAGRLPDLPRWVETRAMLLSGRSELVGTPGPGPADFLVRGTDFGLFCVAGSPDLSPLPPAVAHHGGREVLCLPASAEAVAAQLREWTGSRAVIHSHPAPEAVTGGEDSPAGGVSMLSPRDAGSLAHLPQALREELVTALGFTHVAAAFAEGLSVSFCYTASETETLWDISIDTLEPWRGRGLARACCEFLIAHMSRHGKAPVWGALEQNAASMKMAERLGFVPVDELVVFERGQKA
ncbi:MAG: GNAT family N-acetyltransferase [Thermoanaerobaculia bacterium]